MFLTRPVLGKAKNKRFWLVPFWERGKTNVFDSSRFGKDEKQMFLTRPVLGKRKREARKGLPYCVKFDFYLLCLRFFKMIKTLCKTMKKHNIVDKTILFHQEERVP